MEDISDLFLSKPIPLLTRLSSAGWMERYIHDFHDLEVLEIELRHPNSHVDNWCHVIIRVINLLVGCLI
jgi:hypothetical protein